MRTLKVLKCLTASACVIISASSANSADLEIIGGQVILSGEIADGDAVRFQNSTEGLPAGTIVRLQSAGGLAADGIAIGRTIREREFITYAPYGFCASACGLIWLGGVERWINPNARVGFHQVYTANGEQRQTSGVGNALVGAYMNQLGYKEEAIGFATVMQPEEMAWLDSEVAAQVGLDFREGAPQEGQYSSSEGSELSSENVNDFLRQADELRQQGKYYESTELYRRLAEHGNAWAQVQLGIAYQLGKGAPQNDTEAAKWYGLSASQGLPLAQHLYAYRFFMGSGVQKSDREGLRWLTRSAEQGHAAAQSDLASRFRSNRDYVNAEIWYRRAAIQGDPNGQEGLSSLYENGWGVAKDPIMRLMWYDIAISNGADGYYVRHFSRENITTRMTPAQVAEAERRRRLCIDSNYQECHFDPIALTIPATTELANEDPVFEEYALNGISLIRRYFSKSGSDALAAAQSAINEISEFNLVADGRWGPNTKEAFSRVFYFYINAEGATGNAEVRNLEQVPRFIGWLTEAADFNRNL